jgi:putative redox protein
MQNEKITFPGAHGDELSARLSLPADSAVRACALFAHCFTCSKDLKPVVNISRALTRRGIAVMRFDFTGLGESEGDFADTNFSSNIEDLVSAAEFMRSRYDTPALLIGHSLGGAAVIQAAARLSAVQAVATIGAPFDPAHVKHLFVDAIDDIEATGHAEVSLAGRRFTVRRQFIRDLETHRVEEVIGSLERPILIMHSPIDQTVGIDNAARIYKAARHSKSFVSLDDADHLLLDERDSLYAGAVLAAWAGRYIAEPTPQPASKEQLRTSDRRVVARTDADSLRTELMVRGHSLVADEPAAVGGDDTGPSPYELLGAALGACTTMTLQMYAGRKGWPLEEAVVRVRHSKIHAEDEERCQEDGDARLDRLEREVTLVGPLDDAQRARLRQIAERCPVHRTLSAGVVIASQQPDSPPR